MNIIIINNYFKRKNLRRVDKIADALRKLGKYNYKIFHVSEFGEKEILGEAKTVILSGSSASFVHPKADQPDYTAEVELIKKIKIPILGVCFGHQLIGKAFGSQIQDLGFLVSGFEKVEIVEPNDIFSSWGRGCEIVVDQNHRDCLDNLPEDFVLLARSQTCKIEAMKHRNKPVYGVQAHIERATDEIPYGFRVLENFISNAVEREAPQEVD